MEIPAWAFYPCAILAIACSLMVIMKRNPIGSAFSLVLVFFCFAGIYAIIDAHFIAALQILVYAGAVMVLFVFVIMLLDSDKLSFSVGKSRPLFTLMASLVGVALLAFFVNVFKNDIIPEYVGDYPTEMVETLGGNTMVISKLMFSEYILPFEATSILLLGAIVGTVAIAMRRSKMTR